MGSGSAVTQEIIRFGEDFELDPRAFELRSAGRALKLERIPVQVLLILIEQKGQLVTREEIASKIWGKDMRSFSMRPLLILVVSGYLYNLSVW